MTFLARIAAKNDNPGKGNTASSTPTSQPPRLRMAVHQPKREPGETRGRGEIVAFAIAWGAGWLTLLGIVLRALNLLSAGWLVGVTIVFVALTAYCLRRRAPLALRPTGTLFLALPDCRPRL